jgi:hypothetical protein
MDVKILGGHLVVSSMVQHQMTQTVSQNGIHGSNTNILYLINTLTPVMSYNRVRQNLTYLKLKS